MHIFHVFLYQGKLFIQSDNIEEFCNDNELYYKKKTTLDNYCFLEIDETRTVLTQFYSYNENSEAECWRRFIMVGDSSEDFLHVNDTNPEFIVPILKNILKIEAL